jgi:hypothetical protein
MNPALSVIHTALLAPSLTAIAVRVTSLIDAAVLVTLPLVVFVLVLLTVRPALFVVPVFVGCVFVLVGAIAAAILIPKS